MRLFSQVALAPALALLTVLSGCDPAGTTVLLVRRHPSATGTFSALDARISAINVVLAGRGFERAHTAEAPASEAASSAGAGRKWYWSRDSHDDPGNFTTLVRVQEEGGDLRIVLSDWGRFRASAPTRALAAELAQAIGAAAKDARVEVDE